MPQAGSSASFSDRLLFPLEAAGFAAIAGLTRLLPVEQASSLSGAAWRRFAPMNRRHERADRQLAAAIPVLGEDFRAKILDGMWDNLGRTTAESFHLDEILKDANRIETGPDLADAISRSKAGGAVFVSLHLGNWELAVPLLARAGLDVTSVYQRIRNPHVDSAVNLMRAQYYRGGLFAKSADAAKELMRTANRGGTIALLGDLRDFRGESVPFFNLPAPSNTFPAMLARSRDLPLFAAKVERIKGVQFRTKVEEIKIVKTTDRQNDLYQATAALQACFERWIRETPEQWMWGHRRWG